MVDGKAKGLSIQSVVAILAQAQSCTERLCFSPHKTFPAANPRRSTSGKFIRLFLVAGYSHLAYVRYCRGFTHMVWEPSLVVQNHVRVDHRCIDLAILTLVTVYSNRSLYLQIEGAAPAAQGFRLSPPT